MSRTSCISHPEGERLILIRKWQLEACSKDACAAALLNLFEYWHNIKLEQKYQAKGYNDNKIFSRRHCSIIVITSYKLDETTMLIPFTEPSSCRYIYINPSNNRVHVFLPIVGGLEIGTDNTCKSVYALQAFFGKSKEKDAKPALNELIHYKRALEFDLSLLVRDESKLKEEKAARLKQLDCYIESIGAIEKSGVLDNLSQSYPDYPMPVKSLMQEASNLYSMLLRPAHPDAYLRTVNRTFSMNHETIQSGFDVNYSSDSTFCKALETNYNLIELKHQGAKGRLIAAVEAAASKPVDFTALQVILQEKTKALFGMEINFHVTENNDPIKKDEIDEQMGYSPENPAEAKNYINDLLSRCAPTLFDTLPESPFYSIHLDKKIEELSILTQFFLGLINIHSVSQGYTIKNFGVLLDSSSELSNCVAAKVASALTSGSSAEEALCQVVNENSGAFGLKQTLTSEEIKTLTEKFQQLHTTIKDAPHLDEFTLLDKSHAGNFVIHQGSICTDSSQLIRMIPSLDSEYFKGVRDSFNSLKLKECEVPSDNKAYFEKKESSVDKSIDELVSIIQDDEQLKLLPDTIQSKVQLERMKSPLFQLKTLLNCVAKGQQNEADSLLKENSNAQQLLLAPGAFTDYSGRTFNCTAYEYAYWAKDRHMMRMLEKHMDDETKEAMLELIDKMEHIDEATKEPVGLTYQQAGKSFTSAHFDLTPLKQALKDYIEGYDNWYATQNWTAMKAAWMKVGLAQRELPSHVVREYCRSDRSFDPTPTFMEETLPQELTFYNYSTGDDECWFPSAGFSSTSGLGFDFGIIRRGLNGGAAGTGLGRLVAALDLAAVSRLDEVRTADLTQSRENLSQPASKLSMSHG